MKATEFNNILENSDLLPSEVLKKIFEGGFVKQSDFPEAFNNDGKIRMKFRNDDTYNTFCPFHSGQETGDGFAIYNKDKSCFCFNGSCPYSDRPINIIEIIMATVLKLDHSVVLEFELAKSHYWPAVRFLVKHFGDRLGLTMNDVKNKGSYKRNEVERILTETSNYYHFLGTKNEFYNKKLYSFLVDTRNLDNGVVPIDELINTYKLGITPNSNSRDRLYKYLLSKKFKKEDIIKSKVCYERNGKVRDFFYERAIVPYIHKGKVIGFYGRDLKPGGDKRFAHLRLEGEVRIPNGLDGILEKEEFFLVEGEFSKIAVASMGHPNVMETRGVNGFKQEHADLIGLIRNKNLDKCKRCYVLFDPDSAGAESVEKIGRMLINVGVEVLVIRLPILYDNEKTNYVDPNDLLGVYGKDAKNEFEKLKEEAVSYDAFILLHEIQKNKPTTLSEARIVFGRLSEVFFKINKLERIFILEEVLNLLDTVMDKDVLREYLKDVWLNAEYKKPVEGLEDAMYDKSPFYLLTKSEDFYSRYKKEFPFIVLIRDRKIFSKKKIDKSILLDTTFSDEEKKKYFNFKELKVGQGKIHIKEDGSLKVEMIS